MPTIDIKQGDLIRHPKGLMRFDRWENNNLLMFKPLAGAKDFALLEHKFIEMHGTGEVARIERDAEGNPIQLREFGPGEGWTDSENPEETKLTEEGRRALALQFYTKKWDAEGGGSLGDIGLQNLINRWRKTVIGLGYEQKKTKEKETTKEVDQEVENEENTAKKQGKKDHGPYRVQVARLRHCIHNCGRPGERPLEAFRSNRGKNSRRRFDDKIEDEIQKAVDYFYGLRVRKYKDAYGHLRDLIKEINRPLPPEKRFKCPKEEVLRRRINRQMTYDNLVRKTSPREAWKKIHGHREHIDATRPLELAIMDSTPLDCFVIDSTTLMPLGRPNLTACLDVYSRMPLGYCLTFEPPSLYSVMLTLKRVNKNKRYVQKLYPQIKRPWDGWGNPTEIVVDRDWSHQAPSFQHGMSNLGTEVHWAPANTPQYKAICERLFRTINDGLIHKLPGGVRYNVYVMRQVGLDPKKDALVTLDDLNELFHEFIDNYIYDRHDGIGGLPARIWQEGLVVQRRRWIRDVAALDHVLGRVNTASLSGNGIKFKNMRFHDESVTSMLLDDLVRYEKKRSQDPHTFGQARARVIVKWNPADTSSISVWNRGGVPDPYWVSMPNADPKFLKGLSFWHQDRLMEFAKAQDLKVSTEEERWDAYNRLRRHWEKLWGEMPMRDSRQARRGLAWHLGQFDDTTINDPIDITRDDIKDVEVEASTAGLNKVEPEGVPDELAAILLDPDNEPPKGRTPSKAAVAKGQRTKARNKAAEARAEHEAYVEERRGDPTGDPDTRDTPVKDDYAGGADWDDPPIARRRASSEKSKPDSDFASGEGWDF